MFAFACRAVDVFACGAVDVFACGAEQASLYSISFRLQSVLLGTPPKLAKWSLAAGMEPSNFGIERRTF